MGEEYEHQGPDQAPNSGRASLPKIDAGFGHVGGTYPVTKDGTRGAGAHSTRKVVEKPAQLGLDRYFELLLTCAIVYFAYSQVRVAESSSEGSTKQVGQLIIAADRINDAADSFSASSAAISRGIGDAVGKLNTQADSTKSLVRETELGAKAATSAAGAAQESADIARDSMYLSERAWVGMDVRLIGPLSIRNKAGAYVQVQLPIVNVGRTPAQYVKRWAMLLVDATPSTEKIFSYCPITQPAFANQTQGVILFPGQNDKDAPIEGTPPDNARAAPSEIYSKPGPVRLSLVTCIDYTLSFDSTKHHQTAQSFQLSWYNGRRWLTSFPHDNPDNIFDQVRIIPDLGSIAN